MNHLSISSSTPLSRAIEISSENIVQYLIENGADTQHENQTGNLLDLARKFASPQIVELLQGKIQVFRVKKNRSIQRSTTLIERANTEDLLKKKIELRNDLTMNIDFHEFRHPILRTAEKKLNERIKAPH